jgi:hypothetical protein
VLPKHLKPHFAMLHKITSTDELIMFEGNLAPNVDTKQST